MLYLISTPIGNLKDITLRALEVLQHCDYILCEDTRHSSILLKEYQIRKPVRSFHQFNEKQIEDSIVEDLKNGKKIALISDAGTPGICDPGEKLIQRCYQEKLVFTSIPGPCALAIALSLCPFSKENIHFLGFLPKKETERQKTLAKVLCFPFTTIFYESPYRLVETLKGLSSSRRVCLFKELTKRFEEIYLGSVEECIVFLQKHPPKGEFVVAIEGCFYDYSSISLLEHVQLIQDEYHISSQEAIKIVSELRHISKKIVYDTIHKNKSTAHLN